MGKSKSAPKILGPSDDTPWDDIKLLPRLDPKLQLRFIRAELGYAMRKEFPEVECVQVRCPVEGDDVHMVTICRQGSECNSVTIKCERGHSTNEVLDAILWKLRWGDLD